jgi:hypothetical protein
MKPKIASMNEPLIVYLDECTEVQIAGALQERGFSAVTAVSVGMLGASDTEQLIYATERGFMILSHNRRHFRQLHEEFQQLGRAHAGILLLPQGDISVLAVRVAILLDWIRAEGDLRSRLFTWGMLQEQIERGFRLPGYSEQDVRLALGR